MSRFKSLLRRVLPAAMLVTICMLAATVAATLAILGSGSAVLEANVSSRVPVDYSADKVALKITSLSPDIIDAARRDRTSESGGAGSRSGSNSPTPVSGIAPTSEPGVGAPPNIDGPATPTQLLPLPTSVPPVPVPTPTTLPFQTIPAIPTLPALPTISAAATVQPTPTLPPLPRLP